MNSLELQIYNSSLTILDEYKQRLKEQEEAAQASQAELTQKGRRIAELQMQTQRDEELLRKHLEENSTIKKQLKKLEQQLAS